MILTDGEEYPKLYMFRGSRIVYAVFSPDEVWICLASGDQHTPARRSMVFYDERSLLSTIDMPRHGARLPITLAEQQYLLAGRSLHIERSRYVAD